MIKRLSSFFIMMLIATISYQQDPLMLSFNTTQTALPGQTYDVDVRVADFDNLLSAQLFVLWDSTVLEIDTIPFISSNLQDFDEAAFTLPEQTASMIKGRLRISWFAFDLIPKSLPDDHLLFTMRFNTVGLACDTTSIAIGDIPSVQIEVIDENFDNIGAVSDPMPVMIPGTNCGGGTGSDDGVGLIYDDYNTGEGTNICIPMTVTGFDTIETFQGSVMWDPDVVSFTGVQNLNLPGWTQGLFGLGNTDSGVLTFLWFDNSGTTPVSLPDGETVFEICFNAIGALGESTIVKAFDGPTNIQASSPAPIGVRDHYTEDGRISIVEDVENVFSMSAESIQANMGATACVDFTTENFNDISAIQLNMQWDSTVMRYDTVMNLNQDMQIFPTYFNEVNGGVMRFSWNTPDTGGQDLADGTLVYTVCFDVIGDCDESSEIEFVDFSGVNIEIIDGNTQTVPFLMNDGNVTVVCGIILDGAVMQPRCEGDANGTISVDIEGGTGPFTCEWKKNGNTISVGQDNNGNCFIAGQSAGSYTLCVTDANGVSSSMDEVLVDPDPIIITATVTDADCPDNGSISLQVSGGTGTISTSWSPEIDDLTDVAPGTYTVLAEDENGCTETRTVQVQCVSALSLVVTNASACGTLGSIVVENCDGTISVEPPVFNLDAVSAGTYVLTCTDSNGNTSTVETEVLEDAAPEIEFDISTTDAECNGAGGTVSYNIDGGCTPLTVEARNTDLGTDFEDIAQITDYDPGNWEVRVTDNVGTTALETFNIGIEVEEPLALNVISTTGASCVMNGSVELDITGGCNPVCSITNTNSSQSFDCSDKLPAGDYEVRVQDDLGTVRTVSFTIDDNTNVGALTANVGTTDAPCLGGFGAVALNYSGGCEPVDAEVFDSAGNTANASELLAGSYTAVFTDNVGTSVSQSFTIGQPSSSVTVTLVSNINGNVDISVSGGAGGYTYVWTTPSEMMILTQDLTGLTQGGTYQVIVTDANGCTGSLDVFVPDIGGGIVLNNVMVTTDFGGFGTPCAPTTIPCTGEAVINGTITGGTPPYTITLNDGTSQSTYNGFPILDVCAGDYDFSVTDANGDEVILPGGIEVTSPDPIEIAIDEITCADLGEANGSISTFVTGGVGGYSYIWSPAGPDAPNNPNVNIGMYILEVIDDFDCTAEMLFEVDDCEGPDSSCYEGISVMTPNGDGFNEFLIISCANDNPNTLAVYDRWGRVVYETTNYNNNWSGIDLDGELLNEGAYYWVMEVLFNNGESRTMKGTVTLLRNE